jgi:hypothetical protein
VVKVKLQAAQHVGDDCPALGEAHGVGASQLHWPGLHQNEHPHLYCSGMFIRIKMTMDVKYMP